MAGACAGVAILEILIDFDVLDEEGPIYINIGCVEVARALVDEQECEFYPYCLMGQQASECFCEGGSSKAYRDSSNQRIRSALSNET